MFTSLLSLLISSVSRKLFDKFNLQTPFNFLSIDTIASILFEECRMKSSSFLLNELLPRSNEFIFGFLCEDDFSYRLSLSKNDLLRLLFEISSNLIFGQFDRNYATPSAFSSLRVPFERFTPLILLLFASRVRRILMCVCSIVQFDRFNSCKVEL